MTCGCGVHFLTRAERKVTLGVSWIIRFCPLHASAPDLKAENARLRAALVQAPDSLWKPEIVRDIERLWERERAYHEWYTVNRAQALRGEL